MRLPHQSPCHGIAEGDAGPPPEELALDIPLLLPSIDRGFSWNGRHAVIFAQRASLTSSRPSEEAFYFRHPDGSYHELSFRECCRHLTRTPQAPTVDEIALSFEKEPDQWEPDHLRQLLLLCSSAP